jgi:hypothetical protein
VLVPGGRLGLLVFVAAGPLPPPLPEGNEFPSEAETRRLLADAGFALEATGEADLGDSPEECTRRGTPSTPRSSAGTARTRPTGWRRSSRGGSGGCSPTARCGPGSASPWPPDPRDPPSCAHGGPPRRLSLASPADEPAACDQPGGGPEHLPVQGTRRVQATIRQPQPTQRFPAGFDVVVRPQELHAT